MDTGIYYLEPRSAFHLGERGVGLEETSAIAHADTVFSALCTVCREWYGLNTLETLLAEFDTTTYNPPFLLTSAFPYIVLPDRVIRLYPRPLGVPPGSGEGDLAALKSIKGITFVSEAIFLKWADSDRSLRTELPSDETDGGSLYHEGRVWLTGEEARAVEAATRPDGNRQPWLERDPTGQVWFWKQGTVPRVTVDRISNVSAVYQSGRVSFAPHAGLWIGICWRHSDNWKSIAHALFEVLGDSGLGGERSAGHGQFKLAGTIEEIALPEPGARFITLSPYWPRDGEEAQAAMRGDVAYSLITRGGWIGSVDGGSLRRKAVRMIGEGSILTSPDQAVCGGLADVTPDVFRARATYHNVWRYGYAFPVGLSWREHSYGDG